MSRKIYPTKQCDTCTHVIDIDENQYGHSYITCECDKCEYEASINAKEVMEALLDGKMVVEVFPNMKEICYRLNGDNIEYKQWGEWNVMYGIPSISHEYGIIEGKGVRWRVKGRKGKKTEKD